MTTAGRDWDEEIQAAAEKHLDACAAALWAEEDEGTVIDSPASAPYCGCTTCVVREVLSGAWPVIEEMFRKERREGS